MGVTVGEIARQVSGTVRGNADRLIIGAQGIRKAGPGDLTFAIDAKNLVDLRRSQAGAALVPQSEADRVAVDCPELDLIFVADPFEAFMQVLPAFRPTIAPPRMGISPAATVHPSVQFGEGCQVFPGAYLAEGVTLGRNCVIHPGVFVGEGCQLGDDCQLHAQVVLYPQVIVGNRVSIHANAVIGADGFGYRFQQGAFRKIPQLGWVIIEDDVEIGACATVDRGMIGPTIIGMGTKLDNLVMIGHNCELGKHNAFASQVGLAGSVTTGDYVRCAGQVGVADHVHLGTGCVLGAKAGVHKDMEGGKTYLGIPAEEERETMKLVMSLKKLPELRAQLRHLQAEVRDLQHQLSLLGIDPRREAA